MFSKQFDYRIVLEGHLDARWRQRLGGTTLSQELAGPGGVATTVLCGRSIDQAALQGVLFQIFGLGMLLRCVHCVAVDDEGVPVA